MYTLLITVEVPSGWFSHKWGKESVKKLVLEAVYLMAVKKKKKTLLEKQDKDGKDSKAELGFALCQGFTHLALASILAFSSK